MMSVDEAVQVFSTALSRELCAGSWGDIPPEVFQNIAQGNTTPDQMRCNKDSPEDMCDMVFAMRETLTAVFESLKS